MADFAELGFKVDSKPLTQAAAANDTLAKSADRAERATDRFNHTAGSSKSATDALVTGANKAGLAVGKLNTQVSSFNAGGIAAQFQDIGVTSAMGMNPLLIALQQGTQLSGQLSTMTGSLWKNLAAGLASVVSPLSLLTIGFVALLAAGIQFVNWGKTAEVVLNVLADGVEVIGPYAVVAAAGLALLYSPAIISGIVTLTKVLYGAGTAALSAAADFALANPAVLIIAGIIAAIAALVIFRDKITEIFGRDIVGDIQDAVNYIIGAFVGALTTIKDTWALLPTAMADLTVQAANGVLNAINDLIDKNKAQVTQYLAYLSSLPPPFGQIFGAGAIALAGSSPAPRDPIANPNKGAADAVANAAGAAFSNSMGKDYVGEFVTAVQTGAGGAADALRGLADQAGKSGDAVDKAGQKAAAAYAKIVEGGKNFIAQQQLEAQALGMTTLQANSLRYAQDLLNQATEGGKTVTAAQRAELTALGAQMAAAEDATNRLTEAYNFGKSTFGEFFTGFSKDLQNGTSLWQSFANAAVNALGSIANKLASMAADGLFDMLFNAVSGSLGGGSLGNGIGVGISGAFSGGKLQFASGGYTGSTGTNTPAGVVHGQEYVLNAQATRSIGLGALNAMNDNGVIPSTGGSGSITIAPVYQISGLGLSRDEVDEIIRNSNEQLVNSLPDQIQAINADPRKRRRAA